MQFRTFKQYLAILLLCSVAGVAQAAPVNGNLSVTGAYTADNSLDLATSIALDTVMGSFGSTGDVAAFVSPGDLASSIGGPINLASLAPVSGLFIIGGFQLDLSTLSIIDQTSSALTLQGSGALAGNGFDVTAVDWSFSANASATNWSMTVSPTPVPVPAAVWLFGSGLLGLVGIARRRRIA